jgi:hypothetical protein
MNIESYFVQLPGFQDRHGPIAETNGFPPVDDQQDYSIVKANANETHTIIQFQRKMHTCDEFDRKITVDQ